jgi:hypothetical protein
MARASSTDSSKTTRPRKSPAERAQLDYDKALKAHEKAVERRDKIKADIDEADSEVSRTKRYLDFARMNPDLPPLAGDGEEVPADASGITADEETPTLQPA